MSPALQVDSFFFFFLFLQVDSLPSEPPGKHHILGDLNNRSLWSHISGDEKSRIKVLAELVSVRDCEGRV